MENSFINKRTYKIENKKLESKISKVLGIDIIELRKFSNTNVRIMKGSYFVKAKNNNFFVKEKYSRSEVKRMKKQKIFLGSLRFFSIKKIFFPKHLLKFSIGPKKYDVYEFIDGTPLKYKVNTGSYRNVFLTVEDLIQIAKDFSFIHNFKSKKISHSEKKRWAGGYSIPTELLHRYYTLILEDPWRGNIIKTKKGFKYVDCIISWGDPASDLAKFCADIQDKALLEYFLSEYLKRIKFKDKNIKKRVFHYMRRKI